MTISRRIARPLLSSIFISGGIDALRNVQSRVPAAEKVLAPLSAKLSLPGDTATLVRANAAVQVGAGVLLSTGRVPRVAALALAGSLIPTTLAGHRFWEESDALARKQQQNHFFKNLAIVGGLLIAAFDTEGAPSLGYRARRRASQATNAASSLLPS